MTADKALNMPVFQKWLYVLLLQNKSAINLSQFSLHFSLKTTFWEQDFQRYSWLSLEAREVNLSLLKTIFFSFSSLSWSVRLPFHLCLCPRQLVSLSCVTSESPSSVYPSSSSSLCGHNTSTQEWICKDRWCTCRSGPKISLKEKRQEILETGNAQSGCTTKLIFRFMKAFGTMPQMRNFGTK